MHCTAGRACSNISTTSTTSQSCGRGGAIIRRNSLNPCTPLHSRDPELRCRLERRVSHLPTRIAARRIWLQAANQNQAGAAEVVELPSTQQTAVAQASSCVKVHTAPLKPKKLKKGFAATKAANNRFCIEIPTAEDSPAGTAAFVAEVLRSLQGEFSGATVVFANEAARAAAKLPGCKALELREACRSTSVGGPLVIVRPAAEDVALVEQLVCEVWQGPYVLLVSPQWQGVPQQYRTFAGTFEVLYSLLPIAIQGLLGSTKEGAVLRVADKLDLSKCPWALLYSIDGKLTKVFVKATRPTAQDIETVFYNVDAATSPMARGIAKAKEAFSGLKGLMGKK